MPTGQHSSEHKADGKARVALSACYWQPPPKAQCVTIAWPCGKQKPKIHCRDSVLPTLTSHMLVLPASTPWFSLELALGHPHIIIKSNHQIINKIKPNQQNIKSICEKSPRLCKLYLKVQVAWCLSKVISGTQDRTESRPSALNSHRKHSVFSCSPEKESGLKGIAVFMVNLYSSATLHDVIIRGKKHGGSCQQGCAKLFL